MLTFLSPEIDDDSERKGFPRLADLLGGWFHQDLDLESDDFRVIVLKYKEVAREGEAAKTAGDIVRFIERYGESDEALGAAVERVFTPEVIIEGWNGLTAREWLSTVAELLKD